MAKRIIPSLGLVSLLFVGCSNLYVITLDNGSRITTKSKPRLERGQYLYQDSKGVAGAVPAGRVREISPASMAKDEMSQFYPGGAPGSR